MRVKAGERENDSKYKKQCTIASSSESCQTRGGRGSPIQNVSFSVHQVLFRGKRAVGVRLRRYGVGTLDISAKCEVIISAGTVGSPQLLLLSGVGPKEDLEALTVSYNQGAD